MTTQYLRGTQPSHCEDRRHSGRPASHTIRVGNGIDQSAGEDGNGQVCCRCKQDRRDGGCDHAGLPAPQPGSVAKDGLERPLR